MFDVAIQFMIQLVDLMIPVFSIYVILDLTGSLMFGKR